MPRDFREVLDCGRRLPLSQADERAGLLAELNADKHRGSRNFVFLGSPTDPAGPSLLALGELKLDLAFALQDQTGTEGLAQATHEFVEDIGSAGVDQFQELLLRDGLAVLDLVELEGALPRIGLGSLAQVLLRPGKQIAAALGALPKDG